MRTSVKQACTVAIQTLIVRTQFIHTRVHVTVDMMEMDSLVLSMVCIQIYQRCLNRNTLAYS